MPGVLLLWRPLKGRAARVILAAANSADEKVASRNLVLTSAFRVAPRGDSAPDTASLHLNVLPPIGFSFAERRAAKDGLIRLFIKLKA